MAGIGGAIGSWWWVIVISAFIASLIIAAFLFDFSQLPGRGLNIGDNTSSPPSMIGLRKR
jgi:hypothetical protein